MEQLLINESVALTIFVYAAVGITLGLVIFKRQVIAKFSTEVRTELIKCTWPWEKDQKGLRKYRALINTTVLIVISTILLAAYISGFDYLITKLVGMMVKF
ncbi:MAG: preprotein translocase subunit SecE [Verrucomicrobiota bacterium]